MSERRLQAPVEDGDILAVPPLSEAGRILSRNRDLLAHLPGNLLGKPWNALRNEARGSVAHLISAYLGAAGEPIPHQGTSSFIMAGHQPELFHPGVWVKNFVLNGLARRFDAAPLNLIVDNDVARPRGVHVPLHADSSAPVRVGTIPFEGNAAEEPYEERVVSNEDEFARFPARLRDATRSWGFQPIAEAFWSDVMKQVPRTRLLGERFAGARRALERRWGCHNSELPVSAVCASESFAWFACHVLLELRRFHAIHNGAVGAYRRLHGLRSRNHPVPDLGGDDGWLEAPFWAWRPGQKQRWRLFARCQEGQMKLRAGDESWPTLPLGTGQDAQAMVRAWRDLEKNGFKVRSRALTNTLFCRLFVADLFIHGIGGGKYDEVTDEIVRRFYGFEPPGFLVLSATLLLPFFTPDVRHADTIRLAAEARDLHYNPQRHLGGLNGGAETQEAERLAAQKHALIGRSDRDRVGRRQRFHALQSVNALLRSFVETDMRAVRKRLGDLEADLQAKNVLCRRDYSFCLFPEDKLRPFCTRLFSEAAAR